MGVEDASTRHGDIDFATRTHLPQGAPTSPALANAIAFRLDRRLAGLARSLGVIYTRYADDLVFSGDDRLSRRTDRLVTCVAAIAMEEGFVVNFRKTRVMRRGQQQCVLGWTVNEGVSTPRKDYEGLKATLHNCVCHGPKSQNRHAHPAFRESLRGRIANVARANPKRAFKLMQVFNEIDWQDGC